MVQACAAAPAASAGSVTVVLRGLTALSADAAQLAAPLQKLAENSATAPAALPLIAKWDASGTLSALTSKVAAGMARDLADAATPDARRVDLATGLLSLPANRASALAQIAKLLGSASLQTPLLAALDSAYASDVAPVLTEAFVRTRAAAIFELIVKRPESAQGLLGALRDSRLVFADLGPANAARLRTHPNRGVARDATDVLAKFEQANKAKDEVIAKLLPDVEKPGDVAKGKALFTGTCAVCHMLGDLGTRDVGTPLAGIGSHPVAELLTSVVDPNRVVEPNYWQWNITTKKGETLTGVIARESSTGVTLRNQGGDLEVKAEDIATREDRKSTRLNSSHVSESRMPSSA